MYKYSDDRFSASAFEIGGVPASAHELPQSVRLFERSAVQQMTAWVIISKFGPSEKEV